jgi:hypothetical protein
VWGAAGREEEARAAALDQGLCEEEEGEEASCRELLQESTRPCLCSRWWQGYSGPIWAQGAAALGRHLQGVQGRASSTEYTPAVLALWSWGDLVVLLRGLQAGIQRGSSWASSAAAALSGHSA